MKTTQFFTAVLVIASLSFGSVSASESTTSAIANKNLTRQIQQTLSNAPFESMVNEPSELIVVIFRINQNHEFELIRVIGQNEELINYSTRLLSHKNILVSPEIEPKSYNVPVRFIYK
jgi:hypothetical protein